MEARSILLTNFDAIDQMYKVRIKSKYKNIYRSPMAQPSICRNIIDYTRLVF